MTAKRANAALEGGGVDYRPRPGFVHFVHVDHRPVAKLERGHVETAPPPRSLRAHCQNQCPYQ
jgi:hypothetical protein